MIVDERYSIRAIRRLSSKSKDIPPEVRKQLEGMFSDKQSDEFYAGLLSGFASSEVLIRHNLAHYIPLYAVFLAEKLEKKEIV